MSKWGTKLQYPIHIITKIINLKHPYIFETLIAYHAVFEEGL